MKKFLSVILAVMLVVSLTASVFAEATYTGGVDARVKTYVKGLTVGPTLSTTVTTGNRILGFSYTDSAAGTGSIVDGTSVAAATSTAALLATYLVSEISVAAGGANTLMFPFPRNVENGLIVLMTTATGCITVYYQ